MTSNVIYPNFFPTYLYIERHSITGLLYFGKTCKNPEIYPGSGKYWRRHLKTHGNHVDTLWWCLFYDEDSLNAYAVMCSEQWNIIDAKNDQGKKVWANLVTENGLTGTPTGTKLSPEHRLLLSQSQKLWYKSGNEHPKGMLDKHHSEESKLAISVANTGKPGPMLNKSHSEATLERLRIANRGESNGFFGKTHSEETIQSMRDAKLGNKDSPETLKRKSIAQSGKNNSMFGHVYEIVECPHCHKIGGNNMKRYHFDNCKTLVTSLKAGKIYRIFDVE